MSLWTYLNDQHPRLLTGALEHATTVLECLAAATALGVAIALATHRSRWAGDLASASAATVLTVPALALIGLLVALTGAGPVPALIALTLYGLLPVARSAIAGLRGVDPTLVEAARGIGMSRTSRLLRVELPLAWPRILGGIRVATRLLMGIAAIAAYASGPGLGGEIFHGLAAPEDPGALDRVLAGTLGIALLSLLFEAGYVLLGRFTIARGTRV
ncbi:ABC transporter permease [Streptomyces sp. NPDC093225]|uniref:ABC transporter permease n=1 Tax=Streptomyces sp. NPDC093225 TaxID=3366034 RepID=UPI0037F757FF